MPQPDVYLTMLAFVRERAARTTHTEGSAALCLPAVMLLAYNRRLRITDTDGNFSDLRNGSGHTKTRMVRRYSH
jgi:hypothetical protein